MALIATVNGVRVYSDKHAVNFRGSRIEFTDGSWCDVDTKKIVNRGPGEISFDEPSSGSAGKITKGPDHFHAESLDLRDLTADVSVEPHDGNDMEVTITGPENEVKAIRTNVRGQTLVIEGSAGSGQGGISGINIVSRGGRSVIGGNVVIGGVFTGSSFGGRSSIIISGDAGESLTKVTVKVPKGTSIVTSGLVGDARIGNIEGQLTAHVTASGDLVAGRMTNTILHVQGSGDIRVAEINGGADIFVQGSGDVNIDGGSISMLNVSVQGSGDVSVDAVAQAASLSVQGSGDIRVKRVRTEPRKRVQGSGDIRVRHVG